MLHKKKTKKRYIFVGLEMLYFPVLHLLVIIKFLIYFSTPNLTFFFFLNFKRWINWFGQRFYLTWSLDSLCYATNTWKCHKYSPLSYHHFYFYIYYNWFFKYAITYIKDKHVHCDTLCVRVILLYIVLTIFAS